MKFYQDSTGRARKVETPSFTYQAAPFSGYASTYSMIPHIPVYEDYFTQIFKLSTILTQQLIKNSQLLSQKQTFKKVQKENYAKKQQQQKSTSENKDPSQDQYKGKLNAYSQDKKVMKKSKKRQTQSQQYRPFDESSNEGATLRISESKNIPKNYGKAILNFISKNNQFSSRIFNRYDVNRQDFFQMINHLKSNLNTISQLRSMWLEEQNKYAKVLRIFSIQYLRKHSLGYIFNSRIQNYKKHIKYRNRIIQSVKDPKNFTFMKEF